MANKRLCKTRYYIESGMKKRVLTRSFDTLEKAEKFACGKTVLDIYKINNRFKVEWVKTITLDEV